MRHFGLLLLLLLAPVSGARGRKVPFRLMTHLPLPGGHRTIDEELEDIPEEIYKEETEDTPPSPPPLPPYVP